MKRCSKSNARNPFFRQAIKLLRKVSEGVKSAASPLRPGVLRDFIATLPAQRESQQVPRCTEVRLLCKSMISPASIRATALVPGMLPFQAALLAPVSRHCFVKISEERSSAHPESLKRDKTSVA